jgi:Cof subfamily protein (haloacid dehalogenase superfamily)
VGDALERVRLVATDMDGTLLGPDGTVSPRTMRALARLRAAGVAVVLVTGRPPRWVRGVLDDDAVHELVICTNGAVVYDPLADRIVAHEPLDSEVAASMVERLRQLAPGVVFAVESGTGFRREPGYRARAAFDPVNLGDAMELVGDPVSKLLVRHPELPFERLYELAVEVAGTDAVATFSNPDLVEVSAAGVTKASALARLCAQLGIGPDEVVAIGDMPNDLPMLAWAGYAVAVANAHPEVLEAADEVTAANADDGVAQVLERILAAKGHR